MARIQSYLNEHFYSLIIIYLVVGRCHIRFQAVCENIILRLPLPRIPPVGDVIIILLVQECWNCRMREKDRLTYASLQCI
jgi:hypothetical protein